MVEYLKSLLLTRYKRYLKSLNKKGKKRGMSNHIRHIYIYLMSNKNRHKMITKKEIPKIFHCIECGTNFRKPFYPEDSAVCPECWSEYFEEYDFSFHSDQEINEILKEAI